MSTEFWLTAWIKPALEKCGEIAEHPDMTSCLHWRLSKKPKKMAGTSYTVDVLSKLS